MQKENSAMFGYLRGVTDQLCRITPKGVDAVRQHMETLKTFGNLIQDVMDDSPGKLCVVYDGLMMRVYERIEELAEPLEELSTNQCNCEKCALTEAEERLVNYAVEHVFQPVEQWTVAMDAGGIRLKPRKPRTVTE
jgi:hypothetical protein